MRLADRISKAVDAAAARGVVLTQSGLIGMVCLPAESLNEAHAKGADAILRHKHMARDDIEGLVTFVKEVPSLRPAQWG